MEHTVVKVKPILTFSKEHAVLQEYSKPVTDHYGCF